MKKTTTTKLMLSTLALAALAGSILFTLAPIRVLAQSAPDITGTWQGTLQAGTQEARMVIKISKVDGGGLKGMLYFIDEPGPERPIGAITIQGATVKMSIPSMGTGYEGKLDSDGVNLNGSLTEGTASLPLNLKHVTDAAAWETRTPPPALKPMAPDANPVFEVATIKPSRSDERRRSFRMGGRQYSATNTSLSDIIQRVYGVHARQITGGPAWMESDKYDIAAKPDGEGQPNPNQWGTMVQKLLADRFKLTFHHDKKELTVFAIVVGKNGPKLTKDETDPNGGGNGTFRALGWYVGTNVSIAFFASGMQRFVLDRPVVDQTGLKGKFDIELKWTPDETQYTSRGGTVPAPIENVEAPPDLFTAIQQQLGLKLESVKAAVDVIVIDHVEKPSEN